MSAIKVLFSRRLMIILLLSLVGGSFSLYAEDAPKKEQTYQEKKSALLDIYKSKELLEKEKLERERQAKAKEASGDHLDSDMKELEGMSQNIVKKLGGSIDPRALKLMKNSLPADLLKSIGHDVEGAPSEDDDLALDPVKDEDVKSMNFFEFALRCRDMSQFQNESFLKLFVMEQSEGAQKFFLKDFPRLIPYAATVLRHKTALPSIFEMYLTKKKELLILLVIFVLAGFIGKFMKKFNSPTKSFAVTLGRFFMRFTVVWAVRIGAIVVLVGGHFKPLVDVTIKFLS